MYDLKSRIERFIRVKIPAVSYLDSRLWLNPWQRLSNIKLLVLGKEV
jgi:hypothetical protein